MPTYAAARCESVLDDGDRDDHGILESTSKARQNSAKANTKRVQFEDDDDEPIPEPPQKALSPASVYGRGTLATPPWVAGPARSAVLPTSLAETHISAATKSASAASVDQRRKRTSPRLNVQSYHQAPLINQVMDFMLLRPTTPTDDLAATGYFDEPIELDPVPLFEHSHVSPPLSPSAVDNDARSHGAASSNTHGNPATAQEISPTSMPVADDCRKGLGDAPLSTMRLNASVATSNPDSAAAAALATGTYCALFEQCLNREYK